MAFRFKQFVVEDDRSTMRVGTDAVLLGAWVEVHNAGSILEIGTGCGVISLMIAQRSAAIIDAIDPDEASAVQAGSNFRNSPWSNRLSAIHISLQDLVITQDRMYDLVIANPPFFTGSLQSPDERKNRAKHTQNLAPLELITGVKHLLQDNGIFFTILPADESRKFSELAGSEGLFIRKQMNIKPRPGKPVNRVLTGFGFHPCEKPVSEELVIRNPDNGFTVEYISFTQAYYYSLQ